MKNYQLTRVTPEMAKEYLEKSNGNRTLSRHKIDAYKKSIIDGEWYPEVETISFDTNGHLINGHHRLTAINQSGITVDAIIQYDVRPEAVKYFDTGKSRSIADILSRDGVKHARQTEAVLRNVFTLAYGFVSDATVKNYLELYNIIGGYITDTNGINKHATHQTVIMLGKYIFNIDAEVLKQITSGYNVAHNSIADRARKILFTQRINTNKERYEASYNCIELFYRFNNGMPFVKPTLGSAEIRAVLRDMIINWIEENRN